MGRKIKNAVKQFFTRDLKEDLRAAFRELIKDAVITLMITAIQRYIFEPCVRTLHKMAMEDKEEPVYKFGVAYSED